MSVNMQRQVPTDRKSVEGCSDTANSSIAKVHQAQFREETNPRDHAKTGSDDPEGAGPNTRRCTKPKRSSTEFEAAHTPAALREEQTQSRKSRKAPGRAKHLERSADKTRTHESAVNGSRGNGAGRA